MFLFYGDGSDRVVRTGKDVFDGDVSSEEKEGEESSTPKKRRLGDEDAVRQSMVDMFEL